MIITAGDIAVQQEALQNGQIRQKHLTVHRVFGKIN